MPKKVGVITMHRVINYGSFLQAYATQYLIQKQGFECEIIDYVFPNSFHKKNVKTNCVKNIIRKIVSFLNITYAEQKKRKLLNTIKKKLILSSTYHTREELFTNSPMYDIYLTGSDQTLNPKHTKGDSAFLLAFAPKSSRRVAFSASLGDDGIADEYIDIYKEFLPKYDFITLREKYSFSAVKSLSGKSPKVTLDPSLLLTKQEWVNVFSEKKFKGHRYILFYLITHSFDPGSYIFKYLKWLQNETGLTVYSLTKIEPKYKIRYKNLSNAGVEDFISLLANAQIVVTSSFHGTAFAVNFNIPVYSIVPGSTHNVRQVELLKQLSLEESIIYEGDKYKLISSIVNAEIFESQRQSSINTLSNILK